MTDRILVLQKCMVTRLAHEEDRSLLEIPAGVVLEIISKDSPWFITVDGFMISQESAILVPTEKKT